MSEEPVAGKGKPLRLWLVTLGGAGMIPGAPGTYGSLVTSLLLGILFYTVGLSTAMLIAGCVLFSILCVLLGGWAQWFYGRKDPGPCVLDEAAGICLTMIGQRTFVSIHEIWVLLAGFLAFRIFDITKPPPARQLERLPAGWGILLDDLAAAVYANLLCQIIFRWAVKTI
jgi:phosphatidylglycerophosphatase A